MEVAESSLALAARHSAVPCALLLTDVALSMTLEATRLQLTGKSLLDAWQMTLTASGNHTWLAVSHGPMGEFGDFPS